MMLRDRLLSPNISLSWGAITTAIIGIMVVAMLPPLLPVFIILTVCIQRRFRRHINSAVDAERARRIDKLRQEKVLAVRSLPRLK